MDSDLFFIAAFIGPYPATAREPWEEFPGERAQQLWEEGFEQAAQMKTRGRAAEQNRRGLGYLLSRQLAQAIEDAANE